MQYLAILGRQPLLSVAELESQFSDVSILSMPKNGSALAEFTSEKEPNIARLGGTIKIAKELSEFGKFSNPEQYLASIDFSGKYVIGVSDYSRNASARGAQGEALRLKRILKKAGRSARVIPNKTADLSSASVFHNQLGEKPGHIELVKYEKRWFIGIGVQNINAYRDRDQKRPARDAKVGMLPPKLAQILINLCGPLKTGATVLDPFCGTGVVLQEAMLMGYKAYGTDISERIVGFSEKNLQALTETVNFPSSSASRQELDGCGHPTPTARKLLGSACKLSLANSSENKFTVSVGDATSFTWEQPIDAIACEGYLGPPMSQAPVDIKLKTVKQECKAIIIGFLKNLAPQIKAKTPVVMAIPAWQRPNNQYDRLKILDEVDKLGYNVLKFRNLSQDDLLYYRDGQVVAREIIVLRKK